ncbi:MAG: DMT family transporter [Bdellovibrionales bacterium]|nr:DMT family transporter [Bdellovibrionales bacterium]
MNLSSPLSYALGANICFSIAIIFFTSISNKANSIWTNTFKAIVALVCFLFFILVGDGFHSISSLPLLAFFISGAIGLAVGDIFLIKAFTIIGPSRTMVLFGFQPLIMAIFAFILFNQPVSSNKLIAVIFLIGCLLCFSFERFKENKSWGMKGIFYAFIGVFLDASGILLTRYSFDNSPYIHVFEGNFYRCIGALIGFLILNFFYKRINLVSTFNILNLREKWTIIFASFLGTFLSLALYLNAIKGGHLASVTAIAITGPFFSAIFEHLYFKKKPTKFFILSLILFIFGFYLLNN